MPVNAITAKGPPRFHRTPLRWRSAFARWPL